MEVHISSDDRNFITNICNDVKDRLTDLRGYACFSGYNLKNQYEYKIFKGTDDLTEKFPKRITFGEMINLMFQSKGLRLYFQREDWRNTHNCIAMNNSQVSELYLEIFYEDNRYAKGHEQKYEPNEIPIDSHPYIPTYDDMFRYSWVVYGDNYKSNNGEVYEEEKSINDNTI